MINYSEDWVFSLVFRWRGTCAVRSCCFALPAAALAYFLVWLDEWKPTLREDSGVFDASSSQIWTAATAVLSILLSFRTSQAMSRFWEGTSLLHQMRGEWFDAVSCCVTFTRSAATVDGDKRTQVMNFRHTLVRLMSLCHGSALEEITGEESKPLEVIDIAGLHVDTLKLVHELKEEYHFNRVELLLHLSQTAITKALEDGVITVAPPILSRVYQTLSRGFVNLLNAKKICDTRFPFPYAQLISILLLGHMFLTPIVISSLFRTGAWAAVFTFVPVFGTFSLSFIAAELENPFGNDANDLPLAHFQAEMNKCLMLLLHTHADHIPNVGPTRLEFDELMNPEAEGHVDLASHEFVEPGSPGFGPALGSFLRSSSGVSGDKGSGNSQPLPPSAALTAALDRSRSGNLRVTTRGTQSQLSDWVSSGAKSQGSMSSADSVEDEHHSRRLGLRLAPGKELQESHGNRGSGGRSSLVSLAIETALHKSLHGPGMRERSITETSEELSANNVEDSVEDIILGSKPNAVPSEHRRSPLATDWSGEGANASPGRCAVRSSVQPMQSMATEGTGGTAGPGLGLACGAMGGVGSMPMSQRVCSLASMGGAGEGTYVSTLSAEGNGGGVGGAQGLGGPNELVSCLSASTVVRDRRTTSLSTDESRKLSTAEINMMMEAWTERFQSHVQELARNTDAVHSLNRVIPSIVEGTVDRVLDRLLDQLQKYSQADNPRRDVTDPPGLRDSAQTLSSSIV